MPKARAAAERAVALDPRLDSAYVALAEIQAVYDYDWDGAQRGFARAIEVNPACSNAMFSHALLYLAPHGRTKEAIEEMKHALALDPLNVVFSTYLATLYYMDRQNDAAIEQFHKALTLAPGFHEAEGMLFHAYLGSGRLAEARTELDRMNALEGRSSPDDADALLLAYEGRTEAARAIMAASAGQGKRLIGVASVYLKLGEKDRALDALERAYYQRDGMLVFINVWPELEGLKSEPRFQGLLAKLHLVP